MSSAAAVKQVQPVARVAPREGGWEERWARELLETESILRAEAARLGVEYSRMRGERCVVWDAFLRNEAYRDVREYAERHADELISKRKLLEAGNLKLGRSVLIWTLPEVVTCPTPSPYCLMVCYSQTRPMMAAPAIKRGGRPKEAMLRSLAGRLARLFAAHDERFVDAVSEQIAAAAKGGRVLVRIHQDGDFFSPKYFAKWLAIAERHPSVQFMAFTKVVPALRAFVERGGPRNLVLIYSLDRSNAVLLPKVAPLIREGAAKGLGVGASFIYTPSEEEVEAAVRELAGGDAEALDRYEREVLGAKAGKRKRRKEGREEEAKADRATVEAIKRATGAAEYTCPYDRWATVARRLGNRYRALLRKAEKAGKPEPPKPAALEKRPRCGIDCTYCFDPRPTPKLVILWKH